jgi:hypothetical protein
VGVVLQFYSKRYDPLAGAGFFIATLFIIEVLNNPHQSHLGADFSECDRSRRNPIDRLGQLR